MSTFDDRIPYGQRNEEVVATREGLRAEKGAVVEGANMANEEPGEEPDEKTLSPEELRVRNTLGKLQSHVTAGFGIIGGNSAIVLVVASPLRGEPESMTQVHRDYSAASLHHVKGCKKCVAMAYHSLVHCYKNYDPRPKI